MHVAARARLVLARRPWIHWCAVATLALAAALATTTQLSAVDARRAEWGATRAVLVADHDLAPGDDIAASLVDLPLAALPAAALSEISDSATLRQSVAAGEVLVTLDLAGRPGPAARAAPGTVVVGLRDPSSRGLSIGLEVQVAADGLLVADHATIVDLVDDVVFVAVPPRAAPTVAAAAQADLATLLYLP